GNLVSDINKVDFTRITHLYIAFINPDSLGVFPAVAGLDSMVARAHSNNVKILFSLGGPSLPVYLTTLLQPAKRASFITNIQSFLSAHQLDGVDIDLEGSSVDSNYEGFVTDLAAAIKPGKSLSAAVATSNGSKFTTTAMAAFDIVNVMSYDKTGPWNPSNPGQHSPYSMVVDDMLYWNITKGVPRKKLNMGLPFYGYGFKDSIVTSLQYGRIVNQYPGAELTDQVNMTGGGTMYYNGIPTIKSKTTLALSQTGGVMVWNLLQDTTGSKSLLRAINEVVTNSASNRQLVLSNVADEGFLVRSNNKQFLTLTGYARDLDSSGTLSSSSATSVRRSVALIDSNAMLDVSTALKNYCSGGSPKSTVTATGNELWLVGANGGVLYALKGDSVVTTTVSNAITDIRTIQDVAGQLFVGANSSGRRVSTVGTGLPATSGNTIDNLPGSAITNILNPYQFFIADLSPSEAGPDVMYVATKSTSTTEGGIRKFSKVSGTWVSNGNFDFALNKNYKAITGQVSGDSVFLYVTRNTTETAGGELVKIKDTAGYNTTISAVEIFSVSATATPGMANSTFRGVALVPEYTGSGARFATDGQEKPASEKIAASGDGVKLLSAFRTMFSEAQNSLVLNYRIPSSLSLVVSVYDANGRRLFQQKVYLVSGSQTRLVELAPLKPGVYIASFDDGKEKSAFKFIKH
ncbi:MAG: T9SS type A sorting domain-containing protein, partial [Bacteroidetes bacterium]|nr:T9SS type A sorting domain-containing protein [Bacteroidota bacterium]